jgi:hypothetical protein
MEKEFVSYNQALRLKALGFDEECFKCKVIGQEHLDYTPSDYDDFPEQKEKEVLIPTFSQAFRWFREKYYLEGEISKRYRWSANSPNHDETFYQWGIFDFTLGRENYIVWLSGYDADKGEKACTSYEEAELHCLDKLIEIVENR